MSRKWLMGVLAVACVVLVAGLYGCTTTTTTTLTAVTDGVTTVGTSDVTLSGTLTLSDGTVDINMNSILVSGDAISLTTASVEVRVGADLATITSAGIVTFTLPVVTDRPIDIAFILDNTGSMGDAIDGSKDSINAFAASLESEGADAQFGLVTYGDSAIHPTPKGYITAEGFTDAYLAPRPILDFTTANELRDVLSNEVEADGGANLPENPLDAVMYAYNNFSWRTGAQKVFIIITDVNAHQNVPGDTATENVCTTSGEAVVNALVGRAVIYSVSPNYTTSQDPYLDVRRLADGLGEGRTTALSNTGGKWIQFNSGSFDLTALGISTTITASYTVRFDYEFDAGTWYIYVQIDTDGDGVFDSNMVIEITITSGSSVVVKSFGPNAAPAVDAKALKADDGLAKPNN